LYCLEERRFKGFLFDTGEQAGEQFEIGEGVFDLMEHSLDLAAMEQGDNSFEQDDEEEGRPFAGRSPEDGSRNHEDGEKKSQPAEERVCELKGGLRPLHEIGRVDGCVQIFATGGHVLAEIEPIA
jgi:hypothetical protein